MTRIRDRERMDQRQVESRGVRDPAVLGAMRTVPRERFVPPEYEEFAYEDTPLPIEEGQTISQPYIVALMLEALELEPSDRVLEVGAGSGYAAAVMGKIVSQVYAIERYRTLAHRAARRMKDLGYDNVHVVAGDGTLGLPEQSPFDAIAVAAGGPEVPKPLLDQLAVGGVLVIPVGEEARAQELVRVTRVDEHEFERVSLGRVQFVPLIGSAGWALDGRPLERHRAAGPLRIADSERASLTSLAREEPSPSDPCNKPTSIPSSTASGTPASSS